MLNYFLNKQVLVLIFLVCLILLSIPFQNKIDSQRSKFISIEKSIYFKPSTLKKLSLGYGELLSDIYWFRALQYFGNPDHRMSQKNSDLLYNYFDTITELDPKFVNAYRFGGTFLAEPYPIGFGDIEQATKLYEKGRANNPDNFRLPLEEGFIYYIYAKDFEKAAELFDEASKKPGLNDTRRASLKGMAASSRKRVGDRELSKQIWEYIYTTTENEGRKNFALQNLNELNTQDFEDKLTEIALDYQNQYGEFPKSLEQLKNKGYLKKIPKDHEGENFIIASNTSVIRSKSLTKKILDENVRFSNAKARRYKINYGNYPKDMVELKNYFEEAALFEEFRDHPLGEEYIYDPETGKVDYDKWFLE